MKARKNVTSLALGVLVFQGICAGTHAQQVGYIDLRQDVLQQSPGTRSAQKLATAVGLGQPGAIEEINERLIARSLKQSLNPLQIAESAAQSIQNGATPSSVGTTSLVSKPIGALLGIAEEAGAVSTSSSGSTTTLTANIPVAVNYATGGRLPRCFLVSSSCNFLSAVVRGASATVSINSSSSTTQSSPTLTSTALTALSGTSNPVLSGFTVHEDIRGRKNTNIKLADFQKALGNIDSTKKQALLDSYTKAFNLITSDKAYTEQNGIDGATQDGALARCVYSLQSDDATGARLNVLLNQCIESFVDIAQTEQGMTTALEAYIGAEYNYDHLRDTALSALLFQSTFSIEYDFANVLNQPSQSTYKVIYGHQSKSGVLQATANGSTTLYNSLEGSTVNRIRSAQAAVQLDYKIPLKTALQVALSGGYYFQDMVADGLLTLPATAFAPNTTIPLSGNASVLLNTTGPIHIGQGKATFTLKGSNVSIPIAISGASRTDLIPKSTRVIGNFGISYDFSSLLPQKQ